MIGRSPKCDIVINNRYVSSEHAILTVESGYVYIEDNGSTNGTYVDGKRIHSRTRLNSGSKVQLYNVPFDWHRYINVIKENDLEDKTIQKSRTSYTNYDSSKSNYDSSKSNYSTSKSNYGTSNRPLIDIPSSININHNEAHINRNGEDGADWKVPLKHNMGDRIGDYVGSTVGCLLSIVIVVIFMALIALII